MKITRICSVAFGFMFLLYSDAIANPLVLSDANLAVLPQYLWTGSIAILLLEAIGVSIFLSRNGTFFWKTLLALSIMNLVTFSLFSKWLILVDRYDIPLDIYAFLAEFCIIMMESAFIYIITQNNWFLKNKELQIRIKDAVRISFIANSISAISGFFYTAHIYSYLGDLQNL